MIGRFQIIAICPKETRDSTNIPEPFASPGATTISSEPKPSGVAQQSAVKSKEKLKAFPNISQKPHAVAARHSARSASARFACKLRKLSSKLYFEPPCMLRCCNLSCVEKNQSLPLDVHGSQRGFTVWQGGSSNFFVSTVAKA